MTLNDTQTKEVANYLEEVGILKPATKEELLDHLCCEIEDKLVQGMSFEAAWKTTRERWNEDKVQKIHSSTQNSRIMLKLMAAGLITVVIGLFPLQHASPDFQTPNNNFSSLEREMSHLPGGADRQTGITTEGVQRTGRLDPPSYNPLAASGSELSSPYGPTRHPISKKDRFHRGVDLKAAKGTTVFAAGAGEVLEAGPKGAYGNCIIIVHDEIYQTLYAHLENIDVKVGDFLTAGQTIGTVGSTGASTGPHLHYEVIKNGEKVNPADYLP